VVIVIKERVSERLGTHIGVKYFCCNELYSGIITNLSEKDMYMKTKPCFPCNATFVVLMPSEQGIINIPVQISRIHKEGNDYVGMGLKIVGQTEKYLNFVNTLKSVLTN
jgi:hypothetical protein